MRELGLSTLQTMSDEMQAYAHDRAETWQESERGEAFRQRIGAIKRLISELEELA